MASSDSATPTATPGKSNGRESVDLAVYLSSLASDWRAVAPLLDPVRQITARNRSDSFSPAEQAQLEQACHELEVYLTTKERVRAFTPETLHQHIHDFLHPEQHKPLRRTLKIMGGVVAGCVLLAVLATAPLSGATRGLIISSTFFMLIHWCAAWFFITALRSFAPELQRAYRLIASGVIVLGLSQIVQPLVSVAGIQSTPYHTLYAMLPLIPAYVLMYIGVRGFAHVVLGERQQWWLRPGLLFGLLAASIPASILLPHAASTASEYTMDSILVLQAINITLDIALILLVWRIAKAVNNLYAKPLRWLFTFMVISVGIGLYMYPLNALTGGSPAETQLIPLFASVVINGLILLRAGYAFNRASLE